MKFRKAAIGAVLVWGLASTPALAGPYYFHKPGVEREAYVEDVTLCRELSDMGESKRTSTPYTPNLYAVAAASLLSGFMNSRNQRNHEQAIERICMADKGYARVSIDKSEFKKIRKLKNDDDRMEALFTVAAAPDAIGEELPE